METSGEVATLDCNQTIVWRARRGSDALRAILLACLAVPTWAQPVEREDWDAYRSRRTALAESVGEGAIVLYGLSMAEGRQGRGAFRQENNFYYL